MTKDFRDPLVICEHFGVSPLAAHPHELLGISPNVRSGLMPISGVRHLNENGTCGWYIWAGEKTDDPNFFVPMHASCLPEWCPLAMPFLQLPLGWCFMAEPHGFHAWFDPDVDLTPL